MAVAIQVRRGTKAALVSHGALAAGELGFTTDEKLVYVGDGTNNYLVGKVTGAAGDPSGNLVAGTIYINTTSNRLFFCNGSTWTQVGAAGIATLDDLSDGTNYQRVAAADVDASGHVTQIYDGATAVTANTVNGHITDATKHRVINDSGTSETELWSASKTSSAIAAAISGIVEFQDSVKDKDVSTPPGSPTSGDRYIVKATGTGVWASHDNAIATWNGTAWTFVAATEGMACYADDEDILYMFNGTSWLPINNYALASTEPGAVSSSTSGTVGTGTTLARADHSHDLGSHAHADAASGGQVSYGDLSNKPSTFAPAAHGSAAHTGTIGAEADITFGSDTGHDHTGVAGHGKKVTYSDLASIPSSFTPASHNTSHKHGGSDEIATATAAANAIPKAGAGGTLSDGWFPTLDGGTF
jgi:hypothetical protein